MAYAYDFICLKNNNCHVKTNPAYLLGQVKLSDTFAWGEPIYSPINGVIREVVSSIPERNRLHLNSDIGLALFNSLFFSYKKGRPYQLCENYLIIKGDECSVLITHLKKSSFNIRSETTFHLDII